MQTSKKVFYRHISRSFLPYVQILLSGVKSDDVFFALFLALGPTRIMCGEVVDPFSNFLTGSCS